MKFIELKVNELMAFVGSDEFRQMPEIPVTSVRAHSQSMNPSADPNDIGLIYALNEQQVVIGYIGILPARAYSKDIHKIYFVSCWWAHPEAGRGVGIKLFFRMLEITGKKVLFFHLPDKMAQVLKAMNGFTFPSPITGMKGFVCMNSESWIIRRNPKLSGLRPLLFFSDLLINLPIMLHSKLRRIQLNESASFYAEIIGAPENAEMSFIDDMNKGKTIFRSSAEMKWVSHYPWISTDSLLYHHESTRFRFSLLAKLWEQHWIRISDGNEIKGIVFLTIRDGVASFPYSWFRHYDAVEVSQCLAVLMLDLKVKAIQFYNPLLVMGFNRIKSLFIHKRYLKRMIAWSHEMDALMSDEYFLQDGDGDAVFT